MSCIFLILTVILLSLSLILPITTIVYVGPTFDRTEDIKVDDWRRKFILFFAWINIAYIILLMLYGSSKK
jgi:quinol-cytochrome oxidoreductase complex cytochrome b subunit